MSLNLFKEQLVLRKNSLLFFLILSLLVNTLMVSSLGCDKMATLPKDFSLLLPQNEKLKRIHLSNYFFLDDNPGEDAGNTKDASSVQSNQIKIPINEKSVFKLQVTPQHIGVEVKVKINNEEYSLEAGSGIPVDYTSYLPVEKGVIEVTFTPMRNEDEEFNNELSMSTSGDKICDVPYMQMDVYIEEYQHLKERISHIRKETEKMNEFDLSFSEILRNVMESALTKSSDSDMKVKKFKTNLESFKLTLPKSKGLQFYKSFNISVIQEFDVDIPDNEELDNANKTSSHPHIVNKFFLKLHMFSDFFLSGGYYLLLIRNSDLESLTDYQCLYDGKCFLSQRSSKNALVLESILSPGSYKLLFVDLRSNRSIGIRDAFKLDAIPVSAMIKIKSYQKAENRFNCEGRHLPHSFDYLMTASKENYFEYRGDIVMDLNNMYDQVDITVQEDSLLRLITFYPQGNNIDIELYEVNKDELNKLVSQRGSDSSENIESILHAAFNKQKTTIVTLSKNSGESDGLVHQLKKGITYKLMFNYRNSFFNENERKTCEMFYLKLTIAEENYLKKFLPTSCSDTLDTSDLDKLVRNLEQNHQSKEEYSYTTPKLIKVQFKSGEDNLVLYTQKFEIKQNANVHFEVISEFISSYIVPIILPLKDTANVKDVLHHKYKKLIFHENTIKLKLNKGKYMLVLVNGLSNLSDTANPIHSLFSNSVKCMSFKLRVASIRLDNRKMTNWECNYLHYDEIPDNLNDYLNDREKFTYFNKNLLLPGVSKDVPYKSMKISTGNKGYFLRLIAEVKNKHGTEEKTLEIALTKNDKIRRKAKEYIIDYDMTSDQMYLNYYLKPNSEYELTFENLEHNKKGWSYFEFCRLFKLEINMIREDFIKEQKIKDKCVENTPKLEDVVYERLIDVDNSFYKYGTKTAIHMFTSTAAKIGENVDTNQSNLEIIHPKSSAFVFKFTPENKSTGKELKNSFSYTFEVKSYIAKVTVLIENSSALGISAKIRSVNANGSSELISAEDLEEQGLYSIRGVMLQNGKYTVTFYVNTHSDKSFSDLISSQCVTFSASVLIENKPFDFGVRNLGETFENCPYLHFPSNLNIPGWIHADTDYTINEYLTFKLRNDQNKVRRFTLHERSIFKFHLPNDGNNNLLSYISLYKLNANKKQKLVEKFEKTSNYLNTVLEKGTYQFDFIFSGVSDTPVNEGKRACNYFTLYLAVIPIGNVKGGIDNYDPYSRNFCDERGLNAKSNEIKPNTYVEGATLRLANVQEKSPEGKEKIEQTSNAKKIKVWPSNNKGKFAAELIFNHYIDVLYKLAVFQVKSNDLIRIPVELIIHENFVWLVFHFEKHTEYLIEIRTANFDNYSVCSDVVFSYNYEEYSDTSDNQNKTEDEYMNKKDTCHIEDHLPLNFFTNTNHILDKYGGPQAEATGEINFYGEFLLPKSSTELRMEFLIREKSSVFIKIVPRYSHVQTNNIFIQIFRDKKIIYRLSHSEQGGVLLLELDNYTTFQNNESVNESVTPYFLEITFDRVLSNCETFDFIFTIVPRNTYVNEYLACDEHRDQLPDNLSFEKTSQFSYSTFVTQADKVFTKDETGNLYKLIHLDITKATTLTILLEYIISDNMMDILLSHDPAFTDESYDNNYIDLGSETFHFAPSLNGISTKKEISMNLKKGHFILKVLYHAFFLELLKKSYAKETETMCFGFNLEIEGVVLKNLKKDSGDFKDTDETDPNLAHLSQKDFSGNYQNIITSVDPPEVKQMKLNTLLDIEVKFAYGLGLSNTSDNEAKYMKMIYLQDAVNTNSEKIYPNTITNFFDHKITFNFEVKKENHFEVMKCYKLFMDQSFKDSFDAEAVDALNHTYCTVNCDCLLTSNYKCSQKGKCVCHPPYTGSRCEQCTEGYVMNSSGKCVDTKLSNVTCDEKFTCSGHGKCKNLTFDAFTVNAKARDGPCNCIENYTSYTSPVGYPSTAFCNSCTNPKRTFPFCSEKNGADSSDSLDFTFETNCKDAEGAIRLPSRLYDNNDPTEKDTFTNSVLEAFGGGQDADGSLDLLAIFVVKEAEEVAELFIPEESIVRVFYESHEVNRAKVMILEGKYEVNPIAYTEGKENSESFIAKLDAKNTPYYLKIMHNSLKYGCNRYRLKIVIRPMKLVLSDLRCKSQVNFNIKETLLPPSAISVDNSLLFGSEKTFIIPDYLILRPNFATEKIKTNVYKDYTTVGVLSNGNSDEEFVYNIKLDVKIPITMAANALFDFLTSDLNLTLRDDKGKILKSGNWLIPDANFHTSDNDFINGVQSILDPGVYYLTLIQNVPANHLMQIIVENEHIGKTKHVNRCFKFALHLQALVINKPDDNLSTTRFESMYNRLIDVEPDTFANINVAKKFEIFVTFEDSISSSLKSLDQKSKANQVLSFRDVFYLENSRTKEKLPPTHVYLQGALSKTFLMIYDENVMIKDECYELKYNLDLLQSSNDKERKITADSPLVHKYCTKNCNCNPLTHFECDSSGKCECEEPYTGEGCYRCIEGWFYTRGKCISVENCRKNFCGGHGKCKKYATNVEVSKDRLPQCVCEANFTGSDCSSCAHEDDIFPDCVKLEALQKEPQSEAVQYDNFLAADKNEVTDLDIQKNKCAHTFVPHNLDSLGYLHLDGNMHISGKYSLKHINKKYYSMIFTVKERSHVKLLVEHSKSTHMISLFLLDNMKKLLHSGSIHIGPSGIGSSSFIDFVLDPIRNPTDNSFAHYEINFFIKDNPADDGEIVTSYQEDAELENLTEECFTVFLEMQVMTATKERALIASNDKEDQCSKKQEKLPVLVPTATSILDYHTVFFNSMDLVMKKYTHIRNENKVENINYFHYEYFYVPDHLDQELILEIEVYSKFINSHVGVLLEIVEIPINETKIDHKKLNAKMVAELIEKSNNGKKFEYPECDIHCFSGVNKFNSVLLSRVLPSDTFFRIWFYDLSPHPKMLSSDSSNLFSSCVNFEILMRIQNVKSNDHSLQHKKDSALCLANELPSSLNIKGFLGDQRYIEKWGFHILDNFKIDGVIDTGLVHETVFEISEYHLFRMVVFHGRVDTDLELFFKRENNEEVLISRSSSKNFEDAIVIEIPPGNYRVLFKFFPPPSGFHKCESIKMEFSMNAFKLVQENVDRMVARHKNAPSFDKIDFYEHFAFNNGKNIFDKDTLSSRYVIKLKEPFKINIDDSKDYEPSISLAEMTFVVEPEDSGKMELIAFVNSDFLLVDANIYLSSIQNTNSPQAKDPKIISGTHKKNMNVLFSGPLESGTYAVSLRYYRRLHYKNPNDAAHKDVALFRATFAEVEFDAVLVNKSSQSISILTSFGYLKNLPFKLSKNSVSHNWLCRHSGLPMPKTLSSLRFFEFNQHVHILDNFLVPPMGLGTETIKFRLRYTTNTMIRVYVECNSVDIDLELREITSYGQYKVIASSNDNVHFETIMHIISDDKEYEIALKFNGKEDSIDNFTMSLSDPNQSCSTFKMEIAMEKSHNYACPESDKYSELTSLKPIPDVIPTSSKLYRYDSKSVFRGDQNNSGYVYMLRSNEDKVIKYTQFKVESDVDLKVQIENDFMQAPVNIVLTLHGENADEKMESHKLSNYLGLTNAYIISYGEIFENRSVMLAKNLPIGSYTLYLYLPGLETKFLKEPRVCSIYDILVEVKKSRYHFKEKEIIDTAEIVEENLDLPVEVPVTLNSLKFLEGEESYINYANYFYLRSNSTSTDDLYNSITFNLKEESLVEFSISSDHLKDLLQISIYGFSHFGQLTNAVLKPGNYMAMIKVDKTSAHQKKDKEFDLTSLNHLVQLFIGISPVKRVNEIYSYNNLQSTYHQCKSTKLPQTLDFNESLHTYNYDNEFFTFNKEDLRNLKLGQFTVVLKSNNNRIMVEIGADYVLNKISLVVKSEHKTWRTSWLDNVGNLDITVPKGTYSFELEVEERLILTNMDCLILSIDIHIIDNDFLNSGEDSEHPLYNSHIFDSAHTHSKLLRPKCDGSVLPLELHKSADNDYHKIKENGDYLLHINKAAYFPIKQHSQNGENLNEVDINLHMNSIVRVVTYVEKPNEFQIIPKIQYFSKHDKTESKYYFSSDIQFVSRSLKERSAIWFLDKNKDPSDEFYTLEMIQEKYEELTETSPNFHCPSYTLDLLIQSVTEVASRLECISKNPDEDIEYTLPIKDLPSFKAAANSKPYHERIPFTYFTEKQYGDNYIQSDQFNGLQYVINFTVEEESEYHLMLELGYNLVVSSFDVYLSRIEEHDVYQNKVVASSHPHFDKYDEHFPFKRLLNANVTKGKYVLLLVENVWNEINRNIKVHSNNESIKLCVPISYSLDIIPANEKNVAAEVISIFPPGPIAFKSVNDDLDIKVTLSKPAFTRKHEPITYAFNIMNIVNAFFLTKVPTKGMENFNEVGPLNKIHPVKIEGAENNKEWNLLFMKEFFEAGFDYELHLDGNWLYDISYSQFKASKKMPTIRVETSKEAIIDFVDSIKQMKDKMNEADFKAVKDETKPSGAAPDAQEKDKKTSTSKSTSECGEHGKMIYDNIMKKNVCTCFDGFTGKFCQVCSGVYDKVANKCVIKEDEDDDDETSSEPISESIAKHITPINNGNQPLYVPAITETHKSCEGGCINGYCDSKIGRCVCDVNYTGPHCDKLKTKTESASSSTSNSLIEDHVTILGFLFKLIIGAALFGILFYFYTFLRRMHEPKAIDYQSVPTNEFEMTVGSKSINSTEKNNELELISGDNNNLVDYEIKAENTKYKRGKKKDVTADKRNEL